MTHQTILLAAVVILLACIIYPEVALVDKYGPADKAQADPGVIHWPEIPV